MFVEPVYLQAEHSPMPELRIVVLATQEKLAYGQSFSEAMTSLFGEAATQAPSAPGGPSPPAGQSNGSTVAESGKPAPTATPAQNLQQLVERAIQEFDEYQRLTAQGKLGEAGQKLEQHRRTLEEIRKLSKP
jgi:uncharacterized membrane protein (UPF0182 family)